MKQTLCDIITPYTRSHYPLYFWGKIRSTLQPYWNDTYEATEIIKGLWVGSICSPCNSENLKEHGINTIVSVCIGARALYPFDFEYLYAPLRDMPDEDITETFKHFLPMIDKRLNDGRGILVHCMVGASRSVTIVAAYLMKYYHYRAQEALDFMKDRREQVNPNLGYVEQLLKYEKQLETDDPNHFNVNDIMYATV